MEQTFPKHVDLPLLPWVKVYPKEPSAFIYDEHSRECTMFHFGIYRHSACTSLSQFLERILSEKCSMSKRLFYLLWKLRTIFGTFDGVRLTTLFLTLSLLYWKSPTETATIVANYLFNKKFNRKLFPAVLSAGMWWVKKRTLQTDIKKKNEKKSKKKTT